uniref:Uncharacterized protein n=1 Tax=Amphimedon queenslandica TaxID=400682 RepID=A0A1X7UHA1_AMPQE
ILLHCCLAQFLHYELVLVTKEWCSVTLTCHCGSNSGNSIRLTAKHVIVLMLKIFNFKAVSNILLSHHI